jgi:hypothetical protein
VCTCPSSRTPCKTHYTKPSDRWMQLLRRTTTNAHDQLLHCPFKICTWTVTGETDMDNRSISRLCCRRSASRRASLSRYARAISESKDGTAKTEAVSTHDCKTKPPTKALTHRRTYHKWRLGVLVVLASLLMWCRCLSCINQNQHLKWTHESYSSDYSLKVPNSDHRI